MAAWLAVLNDKGAYVRIARAQEGESGVLNLTTLLPSQDHAYVELYLVRGTERRHLHTFRLAGLQRGDPRPQIVVSAHVRGDAAVTLRVNGEVIASQRLALPETALRSGGGALAVTVLLLLLVAAVAFGVTWFATRTDRPAPLPAAARPLPVRPTIEPPGVDESTPEPEPAPPRVAPEPLAQPVEPAPPVDHTIYFEPDRAELLEEGVRTLSQIAAAIVEWIDEGGDPRTIALRVEGHTALYGSERSRFELSERRAAVAAGYLLTELSRYGVRLDAAPVGKGATEPVTRARDDEWRNRRAHITVELLER